MTTISETLDAADNLEQAIGIAIGYASGCWETLEGAGVFQSERAKECADALISQVRRQFLMIAEDFDRTGETQYTGTVIAAGIRRAVTQNDTPQPATT